MSERDDDHQDERLSIQRSLGNIEGTLTQLNANLAKHFADDRQNFEMIAAKFQNLGNMIDRRVEQVDEKFSGHDKRLGSIEKRVNWASGVGAAIIFAVTYMFKSH